MQKRETMALALMALAATMTGAQVRQEKTLTSDWQFTQDGAAWTSVSIPHDWAISGPFDKKWDLQTVAIEQNGEKVATEKSGRSGALPWIGEGQYKTTFRVPSQYGRAVLEFDGAMSEPVVYVNGQEAGKWAYGYNAFQIDVTPYIKKDGSDNELLVKLKNVEESSRWYPGAGLYRPVKVIMTGTTAIDDWESFIQTLKLSETEASISFSSKVTGDLNGLKANISIVDVDGKKVSEKTVEVKPSGSIWTRLTVPSPMAWTPETPTLYTVKLDVERGGKVIDSQSFKTGLRTVTVSKEGGFQLNGKTRKIQGVCLHHDLGPLGAAVNKAAIIRQIRIMKEMGADAIRTAHNMPSQIQMEVCDSMGMMVMAESFDMWLYPKCKNGYARFFNEWGEKDIRNLVMRNRNHPSIVMWSIGNEIPEQGSGNGPAILTKLQDLCHELDITRPVTQGMDRIDAALKSTFAQRMDVPGMNYRVHKYDMAIKRLPQGFLLGSETASTVSSRGTYKFPVVVSNRKTYEDGQCNGYDTEYCSWSNLPEDDFIAMDDLDYTIGQFVWTGFDYLGEPTPYDEYWPSRSSYFGICDLAGLPKDRYYLYRSVWNKEEHTLHVLPHWTWPGREGQVTPVYCYTDAPSAELFVNGKSQGKITKNKESKMDRYRLRWNDVVYEPGEIKVVAYDADGKACGEQVIRTAGEANKIAFEVDRTEIAADGEDIAFVTISLTDKNGNMVPQATDQMRFEVTGAGKFKAACNGDATSLEQFTEPTMKLFAGKVVVLVQASKNKGDIKLNVTDEANGLKGTVTIKAK